jgi:hypothetical protein
VIVPGEKAGEDEWNSFFESIGRPQVDKYELKTPEGKEVNKTFVEKYKEIAHKSGLLPKQAQAIMEHYIAFEENAMKEHAETQKKTLQEAQAGLKREWGEAFDKNVKLAEMAVQESGIEGLGEYLDKTGLNNDPQIAKLLAKMGSMFGEDKLRGEAAGRFGGQTPAEIQLEIDKLMAQPGYFDSSHATHKSLTGQMEALMKKLHG